MGAHMLAVSTPNGHNANDTHMTQSRRPDTTTEGRRVLRSGIMFLRVFQEIHASMPVTLANAFLLVALDEGKSLKEYADLAGMAPSTMSRHLLDLGERNRKHEPGFMLIESRQDPFERRKNMYRLTPKGRALRDRIITMFSKDGEGMHPPEPLPPPENNAEGKSHYENH